METYHTFVLFFPFPSVVLRSCTCRRSWKLRRPKSAPTEAPLSYRKHCPGNASSVVSPCIKWLCNIALCHHVTHLHNLCLAASFVHKNSFSTTAVLCELTSQRRVCLKETGAKTEHFRQEGVYRAAVLDSMRYVCWALMHVNKPIWVADSKETDEQLSPLNRDCFIATYKFLILRVNTILTRSKLFVNQFKILVVKNKNSIKLTHC